MKVRLMRGQVVVREVAPQPGALWTPDPAPRAVRTHTGKVVAVGPPALTRRGVPVRTGISIGDTVQFHFEHHQEAHTRVWPEDGEMAIWIPAHCVDGVWEGL
jgi:co-chaperonin GroES (HSP10)